MVEIYPLETFALTNVIPHITPAGDRTAKEL
jgi:hypothetical protein